MKICLIRPTYGSLFQVTAPLSLGYLSSALKRSGYNEISLIDGSLLQITPQEAANIVINKIKPDVIGIQVYTGSHNWTKSFISILKEKNYKASILVGGPHISALKELAMEYLGAEYGVLGEGENAIVSFVQYVEGKVKEPEDVEGLLFKKNGKWQNAKTMYGFVKDANEIPFPDWELLQPGNYFEFMEGATMPLKGKRPAPILTSRGCPYSCTFCSSGLTNKRVMRYRTPRSVVEEIKFLKEKYGVNEIFIADDNLTMDIKRAEETFDLLIAEKLNVHWRAPNGLRIDRLNESLIKKMSESGCYYVGVGIESGNEEVVKRIKKKINLSTVKGTLDLIHKYKIKVSGFFMCGLPEETEEEMRDSIRFALSVPFDRIQVSNYIPYPGSEDFENIFKASGSEKYIENVNEFQRSEFVPSFQKIPLEKIIALQKEFIRKFYFRPKIIMSLFLNFRFSQMVAIFRHPWIRRWFSRKAEWYDK